MPKIRSIKNAVLNAFKMGNCAGRTSTRRSDHLRQRSPHRKISIASARVTCLRSKKSPPASVTAAKEPFTHGEVREMARWLVEAIANDDLLAATYALKACLRLPWPRGFCLSLCQETINRFSNAGSLDWDRPLAEFHHITCSYVNEEQAQYAKDIAFAGQWLLDRYQHLTGRDPLLDLPADPDYHVNDRCHAVLNEPGETFAEIRQLLIERRRQVTSGGDIVGQSRLLDSECERIGAFITALERLSDWADEAGADAVAILAEELNSQPERIRNGYIRLYGAIGAALESLCEDGPVRQLPAYYTLARDLMIKLQIVPARPDERLVEAARQVLLPSEVQQRTDRTAEIDRVLEKLVSLTDSRRQGDRDQ